MRPSPPPFALLSAVTACLTCFSLSSAVFAQESKSTIDDEAVPSYQKDTPWAFEGKEEYLRYQASISKALRAKKFQELDELGEELRAGNGLRFPRGLWKLDAYYDGLEQLKQEDEAGYVQQLELFQEWQKANPKSISEPIARSAVLVSYGWHARGTGYANTVTEEGWRLMGERLALARETLEQSKSFADVCPKWYASMQVVALGEGWPRAKYDALFDEATRKFPDYYGFYFKKHYYLETKWHGEPGEQEEYARAIAKSKGPDFYTRIIWADHKPHLANYLRDSGVDWSLMKVGWDKILVDYPDSTWNLSNYCKYAVAAKDKPAAKALFEKLGDRFQPNVWNNRAAYDKAKAWANSPDE